MNETKESDIASEVCTQVMSGNEIVRKKEEKLEVAVIIFLALSALLTAWAAWIGALHGENQAEKQLAYNNLSSESSVMYSSAALEIYQDLELRRSIDILLMEYLVEEANGNQEEMISIAFTIVRSMQNFNEETFAEATMAWNQTEYEKLAADGISTEDLFAFMSQWSIEYLEIKSSDKKVPDIIDYNNTYYKNANDVRNEANEKFEQGNVSGNYSDKCNLVTLILSIVLFLLGIVGVFKNYKNKFWIVVSSVTIFGIALIYMLTIPLP